MHYASIHIDPRPLPARKNHVANQAFATVQKHPLNRIITCFIDLRVIDSIGNELEECLIPGCFLDSGLWGWSLRRDHRGVTTIRAADGSDLRMAHLLIGPKVEFQLGGQDSIDENKNYW